MSDVPPSAPTTAAEHGTAIVDAELQALYSALPVGVAFLGPDLRYQRVNETLARLNGPSVRAHVGPTLEGVFGDHPPALGAAVQQVMGPRRPLDLELSTALPHDPADV